MRRHVLLWLTSALLAVSVSAQQTQPGADRTKPIPLTQITIEGKQITGDDVLFHKGVAYVSVPALAHALDASLVSQGSVGVLTIPAPSESECGSGPESKLSDAYRKAAVHIPDDIESLRLQVYKNVAAVAGKSFVDVDHEISEAEFHAQTDGDKSVSYALSHASNTLAIMYYQMRRNVPPETAKQGQLDLLLCTLESKYAIAVGRLSGKERCSVLRSTAKEASGKPAASN